MATIAFHGFLVCFYFNLQQLLNLQGGTIPSQATCSLIWGNGTLLTSWSSLNAFTYPKLPTDGHGYTSSPRPMTTIWQTC